MTPYKMELYSEEVADIFDALKKAMFWAKEHGTDWEINMIHKAYILLGNKQMSGGYESTHEHNEAYMKWMANQVVMHGAD